MTGPVTPDDLTPPVAAGSTGGVEPVAEPPVLPAQRVVSEDELLDLDGPADREPLARLAELLSFADRPIQPRLRRLARMALAILAVVALAGTAGAATHRADVHRAQDRLRDRTLLRLVGASALVGFPGSVPITGKGPVTTQLVFAVRNDGALPESVVPQSVDAAGVGAVHASAPAVIPPGGSLKLRLLVAVDCTSAALVERPKSVTVQASPVAAHGPTPATKASTVTLPFASGSRPDSGYVFPDSQSGDTQVVNTFYELCGREQVSDNGPVTSYLGMSAHATPAKPTATFQIAVRNDGTGGAVLAPQKPNYDYPGLTVRGELPAATVPLADATPVQAGVTVQVTDCAALGTALSGESGIRFFLDEVATDLPLASEPADPRFRVRGVASPLILTGDISGFEQDLLTSLVAACPGLK